ncbi:kelch repeat-containing family protein [Striga asiatica]|uniref:Kelch repeat-containing family protein n=1 Tax=Striga asiatica TaxID=4170 RepID=A0A5A7PYI5_STRAF|nr:kelch repeat-containing family protein [Striga asiatica]
MMASNVKWARNLNKSQLGGVIFGCTQSTMKECLANQLFGLPAHHFSYVKNIEPGLPLFLFDYSERKLHGIYEAASSGKMGIDSYAWTADGSDRTKYPAQVQIRLRLQCQALPEYQFKPIIVDNYYSQSHFWFELDHAQASKLMSKLSSLAVAPGTSVPQNLPNWAAVAKRGESGPSYPPISEDDFMNIHDSIGSSTTSDDSFFMNGNNQLMDAPSHGQMLEFDEKDLIYMKLKEMALGCEFLDGCTSDVNLEHESHDDDVVTVEIRNGGSSSESIDYLTLIGKLCREVEELKSFRREQSQKVESLQKKLAEAEQVIHGLENRFMKLENISRTSMGLPGDEVPLESLDEVQFNLNESILLVGGFDGASWSSALQSFSPSHDVLRSLKPMSSVRSYAAVACFNGELYVFGGGTGSKWYDTVESYDAANDEWTKRACLNKAKGSLAGAALNGKIYAVGGGNGADCFSDVEMFDPYVGRWISARSMLEKIIIFITHVPSLLSFVKRFALASVELNGAIYVVGGYDGYDYLKSAERFDPREHSWTRIKSMDAKRGCLSLVTMNEKLYAIGGYDGTTMVPSVEIYDPRVEAWMAGESMNEARGYSCAAVLAESIYAIGGVKANEDIVEKVECYKEGQGWQATDLSAVGKTCFASAIVLKED